MSQTTEEQKRKWTVLVYLAGDNNLNAEMIYGLLEMKAAMAESTGEVAVVAQLNPRGDSLPVQRYVIGGGAGAPASKSTNDPNVFIARAGSLPADALLADDEVTKAEPQILPELLRLVVDCHKDVPLLAATVSRRAPERLNEIRENLEELPRTARNAAKFINSVQDVGDLLPAFKDAELTNDTGNPWTLLRFLFWGINHFEAENYMVILSGHGSGAVGDFLRDDSSGGSLTVAGLGEVFTILHRKLGRPLGILGLDSCLMSMAEVYCELAGKVDIVIGAEGFEPNTGWPYRQILKPLVEVPTIDKREYAKQIVASYADYYFDYSLNGVSVDLSACDCAPVIVDGLLEKVRTLTGSMMKILKGRDQKSKAMLRDALILAHWKAQTYKFDQYADLHDFCDMLAMQTEADFKRISSMARAISKHIDQKVVLKSSYSGPMFQYSHGLSVYFPWAVCAAEYKDLVFAKRTEWGDLLKLFIDGEGLSRRSPRSRRETTHPVLNKVFKPCPDKMGTSRASGSGSVKAEDDPCKHASMKYTKPCDRGPGDRASSVKNPPIRWAPSDAQDDK